MEINNIVLEKIRENIMKEELNEQIKDWKLSVPDGDINCFISHAINTIINTLKYIEEDNIEYIKKYNLQTDQDIQLLAQKINDVEKNINKTKKTSIQELDKIKKEILSLQESHNKYNLLTKVNSLKNNINDV